MQVEKNLKINVNHMHHVDRMMQDKLHTAAIYNIEDLLQHCAGIHQRNHVEKLTGVPHDVLLKLTHVADLMRIKHVGVEHASLMVEANVRGMKDLARRIPAHLHDHLRATHTVKQIGHQVPSLQQVTMWIDEAKKMPSLVEHKEEEPWL